MTNEFEYLMYLYACAAKSVSADIKKTDVDFYKLYELANNMSLLSTLSYALKISPDIDCPDEIKQKLYSVMLGTSLKNKLRTQAVLKTLEDIENNGIKAVVLKGIDCARYYSKPECRISADTDLLIDEKDEEKLLQYFEQNGYTVHRRKKDQHHSECVSEHTGMFEVHVKIWEDKVFDAMRGNLKKIKIDIENSIVAQVDNTKIRVLNQTDAMIFMTLHLAKHFMFSNANLKMSYDLALYYTNNKEYIDKDRYKKWLAQSSYDTLMSAVFSSMVKYCGFSKDDFEEISQYDETNIDAFVENIEQYKSKSNENTLNSMLVIRSCTNQNNIHKKGKIVSFFINAKKVVQKKFKKLFPKMERLKQSYPCLNKHPYLYFVLCIHRFFKKGTNKVFHDDPKNGRIFNYEENLDKQLSQNEKKRLQMLKDMNLV